MALDYKQSRPVNPNDDFGFNVATYTGAVLTESTFVAGVALVGNLNVAETISIVDSGANGATYDVTCDGGDLGVASLTVFALTDGDAGYSVGDTITLPLAGFTNATGGTVTATVVSVVADTATFDTIVGTGTVGFEALDVIQASELSGGSGSGLSVKVATVDGNGLPTGFTVESFGDGLYEAADSLTYIGTGEVGISDDTKYYDHNQYELGGQVDEYKTGTGLIVTVTTGDVSAVISGGVNYRAGDTFYVAGGDDGATGVVDSVTTDGVVLAATNTNTGVGYTDGDYNTVFSTRKLNTTATGVYAGSNPDNDPTVSVGRLADQEQLIVQQRDVGGAYGTITVFAEPTTVNSVGQVVGNVIRAEDITDEYRCVAVKTSTGESKYKWVTSTTGDASSSSYGYCTERTVAELNADATAKVDADCPAGYVGSGTDCVVVAIATINTKEAIFDADRTTDGTTGTNNVQAMEQCLANGGYYEPNAASGSRCIDASVADNFSLANFAYGTVSSAQDYAATVCRQEGYDWLVPSMTCVAKADVTTLVTQATCAAAGHVWVAGTCYDKADFGDGYSRQGNEGDVNTQPK